MLCHIFSSRTHTSENTKTFLLDHKTPLRLIMKRSITDEPEGSNESEVESGDKKACLDTEERNIHVRVDTARPSETRYFRCFSGKTGGKIYECHDVLYRISNPRTVK